MSRKSEKLIEMTSSSLQTYYILWQKITVKDYFYPVWNLVPLKRMVPWFLFLVCRKRQLNGDTSSTLFSFLFFLLLFFLFSFQPPMPIFVVFFSLFFHRLFYSFFFGSLVPTYDPSPPFIRCVALMRPPYS